MNFLLPIEVSSRELMAKLFMAHQFAMDGHVSYIGEKSNILNLSKYVSPAVYFDKGYHKEVSDKNYVFLKKHGVSIVSLDEENAIDFKDSQQLNLRFPDEILDEFDLIFLWGKKQYDFLFKNRKNFDPNKVVVSGHPRFELLENSYRQLYEDDVAKNLINYKNYILINTNFGLGNNVKPESDVINNYINRFPQVKKLIEYQKMQVANFISLAQLISKETGLTVVLRPHPEESHEIYLKAFSNYSNIHVVYEGSVIPWLIASKMIIHHDCTTSLEAAMVGRSSVAFTKDLDEKLTTDIPLRISYSTESPIKIVELIQTDCNSLSINYNLLEEYFTFPGSSMEKIKSNLYESVNKDIRCQSKVNLFQIESTIKTFLYFFLFKESKLFKQKFAGFNLSGASKIISVFNEIFSSSVKVEAINKYVFKIYKNF
jgi:surface carbohydrate biosynthesis protein